MFPFPSNSRTTTCSTNQSWDSSLPLPLHCDPGLLFKSHHHNFPTAADVCPSSYLSIDPHLSLQSLKLSKARIQGWENGYNADRETNSDICYGYSQSLLPVPLYNDPPTDHFSLIALLLGPMWLPLTRVHFDRFLHTCFRYSSIQCLRCPFGRFRPLSQESINAHWSTHPAQHPPTKATA